MHPPTASKPIEKTQLESLLRVKPNHKHDFYSLIVVQESVHLHAIWLHWPGHRRLEGCHLVKNEPQKAALQHHNPFKRKKAVGLTEFRPGPWSLLMAQKQLARPCGDMS